MKIAIQGHPTRGKEVIQILESLGGKNNYFYRGCTNLYYHIVPPDNIINADKDIKHYRLYTLEEFENEFPFKVGNKLSLYPMKEERNITLTLDKAQEWYKKGGELKEIALQAFSEKELNPLPRSWEEFCEKYPIKRGECILEAKDRITVAPCNFAGNRAFKNWIPSKKSAEAHLAMIQLEQLRNCWWNSWEPEWDVSHKYAIKNSQNGLRIIVSSNISAFLVFPTKEMTEEFLECFKDLIEKAGDLI